jgi:hypothetical protein
MAYQVKISAENRWRREIGRSGGMLATIVAVVSFYNFAHQFTLKSSVTNNKTHPRGCKINEHTKIQSNEYYLNNVI